MPIEYKTIDQTDPNAAERGARKAQEEMEKEKQEERDRLKFQDDKSKFIQNKRKLLGYKFGHMITIRAFDKLDIRDMDYIRIGIFGPFGGGKTSFIRTVEKALYGQNHIGTAVPQGFGTDGTCILDEYLADHCFHLVDTRGLFTIDKNERCEILSILNGKIQPGELIKREGEHNYDGEKKGSKHVPFHKTLHGVIFVFKSTDVRFLEGAYNKDIALISKYFNYQGYTPLTVITGKDLVSNNPENLRGIRMKASDVTGSPPDLTFIIKNYLSEEEEQEECPETNQLALEVMIRAIIAAEKYVETQKEREKISQDESDGVQSVTAFLDELQVKHSWIPSRVDALKDGITNQGVGTIELLKSYWEDIKDEIQVSTGMKRVISKELQRLTPSQQ